MYIYVIFVSIQKLDMASVPLTGTPTKQPLLSWRAAAGPRPRRQVNISDWTRMFEDTVGVYGLYIYVVYIYGWCIV